MRHDSPLAPAMLAFRKMHGLGNDFVVIDARDGSAPVTPALVRHVADRRRGIGCDQVVVIGDDPSGDAAAQVGFWNPDGSMAGACGNASRCVAALLMAETGRGALALRTERGLLAAESTGGGRVSVNMGAPVTDWRAIPLARAVDTDALPLPGGPSAVGMGNPHCVFVVDDAEAVPVAETGPVVERDPLFPERTNVEWIHRIGEEAIRMRVWERGAGITPACGSGACAAAVVAARRGLTGRRVAVHLDGGVLDIDWRSDGVWMTGPVTEVFTGTLALPEAPR